jgi:hypothetical protein
MSDIQDLEQGIKDAEELIGRRQMALKLSEIREFRRLILEDYMVTECARLVQLSADPALNVQQRADSLAMAQATGHLKRYLSMMVQMGAVAERELPQMQAALDETRSMEMNDDDVDDGSGKQWDVRHDAH